jgi:predicted small integral membrane protein
MDTTFPQSTLRWRAITNPSVQAAGYWVIIGSEILIAVILWLGVASLLRSIDSTDFARAKATAAAGLVLGFLLYAVGFVAIGGEWFAMWQSEIWNGQQKAFEFLTMISAVLVILLMPEPAEPIPSQ